MSAAFEFTELSTSVLSAVKEKSRDTLELLDKWGLSQNLKSTTFSFNNHFQAYLKETFALDFLKSDAVTAVLRTCSSGTSLSGEKIDGVSVEQVPSAVINMNFFDRLWDCGVVRKTGSIVKCFDEVHGDFVISDELRKMLLVEESDHYTEFSEEERKEFLFLLFRHLQLGGRINQYEDDIQPYLNTSKLLYKELLTVVKDLTTNALSISQTVLKVKAMVKDETVFPCDSSHPQSFCYLIIDNIKRTVILLTHSWS